MIVREQILSGRKDIGSMLERLRDLGVALPVTSTPGEALLISEISSLMLESRIVAYEMMLTNRERDAANGEWDMQAADDGDHCDNPG